MTARTPGELIGEARRKANLSLRALGIAAGGYSPQYMNDLEHNRRRLAPARWHLLVAALPTLDVRALAEASAASGSVDIDAALLTPAQRAVIVQVLLVAASPARRKPRATRDGA